MVRTPVQHVHAAVGTDQDGERMYVSLACILWPQITAQVLYVFDYVGAVPQSVGPSMDALCCITSCQSHCSRSRGFHARYDTLNDSPLGMTLTVQRTG